MTHHLARSACAALVTGLTTAAVLLLAPTAAAHPLGNFTVNHYTGLTLRPDRVDARLVVDRAEIAAAQERPAVDTDRDGAVDADERAAYAAAQCDELSGRLDVAVTGRALDWGRAATPSFRLVDGEGGLKTSRLTCELTASAPLDRAAGVEVRTRYDTRRVGWQEITARGQGVQLVDPPVPARSVSDELRTYPDDPLADPQQWTTAGFGTRPGDGPAAEGAAADGPAPFAAAGPLAGAADRVSDTFQSLAGTRELTFPVGLLALLLAVVLGASHAVLPGHGKTIMAAYLAGRRGTPRDAVTVGVTVTFTHTAGVLVLGLVLPLATHLAGETVLTWLGATSGLIVTGIGLWMLRAARNGDDHHGHHHGPHGHGHHHGPGHRHGPGHHHGPHHHHEHDHHPEDAHHEHPDPEHAHHDESGPAHEHGDRHGHQHSGRRSGTVPPAPRPAAGAPVRTTAAVGLLAHTEAPAPVRSTTESGTRPDAPRRSRSSRAGLIGLGIAGGLVPSPSALVVLLGAVALGRTLFGVLLVVAYGIGMAATLTLAGLLLVRLRDRWASRILASRLVRLRALARFGPFLTSALVVLVGVGLTASAFAGP